MDKRKDDDKWVVEKKKYAMKEMALKRTTMTMMVLMITMTVILVIEKTNWMNARKEKNVEEKDPSLDKINGSSIPKKRLQKIQEYVIFE